MHQGVDFFLNGGVFTPFFKSGDPFVLSPSEAFIRIPAGYAGLLLLVTVLILLVYATPETTTARDCFVGLVYGIAVSSSSILGLWSITAASTTFLIVWFVDLFGGLTVTGLGISYSRSSNSQHLTRWVSIGVVACLIGGIILQKYSWLAESNRRIIGARSRP